LKVTEIRDETEWNEWVVLPNRFNGILVIVIRRGTACRAPTTCAPYFAPNPVSFFD